jgi:hypothetical protein
MLGRWNREKVRAHVCVCMRVCMCVCVCVCVLNIGLMAELTPIFLGAKPIIDNA